MVEWQNLLRALVSDHVEEKLGVGSEVIIRRKAAAEFFQARRLLEAAALCLDFFSGNIILVSYKPCGSKKYLLPGMQAIV